MASLRLTLALAMAASLASACSAIRQNHGYVADQLAVQQPVEPGVDTKSTVLARLGSPSTRGTFDDENWYYISTSTKAFAFLTPDTTRREVVAVRFGSDDTVTAVETFGLERGRVISYSNEETPTRGRELGFLEQLFGSIGRAPLPLPNAEDNVPGGGRR